MFLDVVLGDFAVEVAVDTDDGCDVFAKDSVWSEVGLVEVFDRDPRVSRNAPVRDTQDSGLDNSGNVVDPVLDIYRVDVLASLKTDKGSVLFNLGCATPITHLE